MTTRTWYEATADRKVHGLFSMTDEQVLARLERGEQWLPFEALTHGGAEAGKRALIRELYVCDSSGVRITDNKVDGLCPSCEGLGCPE